MDFGEVIKVAVSAGAFVGVLGGLGRFAWERSLSSKVKLRDEYRFAKEFLNDIDENPRMHPLVVERGYYALAGTMDLKVQEIKYLIGLEGPGGRLKDYVGARKYLDLNLVSNRVDFKEKYRGKFARRIRMVFYGFMYFYFAVLAILPLWSSSFFGVAPIFMLLAVATIPFFGLLSADSLIRVVRILDAQRLVRDQKPHTELILVNLVEKKGHN